jgi:(p)ppGpp synthase/HD superfamily hydrolase
MGGGMVANVLRAVEFAVRAHGEQKRKYSNEPYILHCLEVARLVEEYGGTEAMIVAAILHDVAEDTPVTIVKIGAEFGFEVAVLVEELTDVSRPEDGNRAARKAIDCAHSARASAEGQTIKVADLISNSSSIVDNAPAFAKVYLVEKAALLVAMEKADRAIKQRAWEVLREDQEKLSSVG